MGFAGPPLETESRQVWLKCKSGKRGYQEAGARETLNGFPDRKHSEFCIKRANVPCPTQWKNRSKQQSSKCILTLTKY